MAISYISGSTENINGGTIVNIGKDTQNNKHLLSSSSNPENIGSVVVNNDHVNSSDPSGIFAYNHSRPISKLYTKSLAGVSKSINGQLLVNNDAKIIRSSLSATAIRNGDYNVFTGQFTTAPTGTTSYLCPDNSAGECFQIKPPGAFIDIPYSSSGGELEQAGVFVRFRSTASNVDDLYKGWNTIYAPPESLVNASGINPNGKTFKVVDLSQVLPNGTYDIEYDTIINNENLSDSDIGRISIPKTTITNSTKSGMLRIKFNGPPPLPPLEFDPDGDGIGNYTNPLLSMELQLEQFNIIAQNQATLDGFINGVLNGQYIISTNYTPYTNDELGSTSIPIVLNFMDPTTGISYYENFNIEIILYTINELVSQIAVSVGSQIPRNGSQTALTFTINY